MATKFSPRQFLCPLRPLLLLLALFLMACQTGGPDEPQATGEPIIPATAVPPNSPTAVLSPTQIPPTEESGLTVEENRQIPDLPPFRLDAIRINDKVQLTWPGTGNDLITHFVVYRRPAGQVEWSQIGSVPVDGSNEGTFTFVDPLPGEWDALEYAVTVYNLYEAESDFSPVARVENDS